mmetsp:Transcript_45059/g.143491  ORF Transcript_45059/g.143491 Transcript_45059/m.143491 type:complete len:399 (-) Transcript_45059:1434-2630(-)
MRPLSRSSVSVFVGIFFPSTSYPVISSRALIESTLHRSSSLSATRSMSGFAMVLNSTSPSTTWTMCSKSSVSSMWLAITLTEHGSAGRMPTSVLKIRVSNILIGICRSCFPTCVSHSLATTKMSWVNAWRRLETARDPKVPPEWETRITIVFVRSQLCSAKQWPVCGMGKSCPRSPRSLLAEMDFILRPGRHIERSATNCSPTHSDTSHPVTRMSTAFGSGSTCACLARSRLLTVRERFHAVMRLSFLSPSCHASWICWQMRGISAMSEPTGSDMMGGRGSTRGLSSSGIILWRSRPNFDRLSCISDTVTRPPIMGCTATLACTAREAEAMPSVPQSRRQISPPRSSRSRRMAGSALLGRYCSEATWLADLPLFALGYPTAALVAACSEPQRTTPVLG